METSDLTPLLSILRPFSREHCRAAIRGQRIPPSLGIELVQRCVIRGMRYHSGFGKELRGALPAFTRALNARLIMDNVVPPDMDAEDTPYCIWHPVVPEKETLRALASRYPRMKYQIGRACAVAGEDYADVYRDLRILPDVHIAEEAREAGNKAIYESIMAEKTRYDVMNDYERTVRETSEDHLLGGALLNGDTAVQRSLEVKQGIGYLDIPDDQSDEEEIEMALIMYPGFKTNTFDITEDMNIDEYETELDPCFDYNSHQADHDIVAIISQPLPPDLPTVDKDLIVLLAAYYGDIDRYSRLRRPRFIPKELPCVVRGIYHNTLFALWWSRQEPSKLSPRIRKAITARMIMNNVVLPSVAQLPARDLPYLIWYPSIAADSTYRELHRLQPSMAPQILRGCLAGGPRYLGLFEEILQTVDLDRAVVSDVMETGGLFQQAMTERLGQVETKVKDLPGSEHWKLCLRRAMETVGNGLPTPRGVLGRNSTVGIATDFAMLYDGLQCNSNLLNMVACMPDEWRDKPNDVIELDYIEWPSMTPK
ncbi:unnamed protein product [Discula destructiva]